MPCRSGSPHGVFGCVHVSTVGVVLAAGGVAAAGAEGRVWPEARTPDMSAIATTNADVRDRELIPSPLFVRLLTQMPIEHFSGELDAFEFRQLCIHFLTPIKRQTDFPGARKDRFIVDGGFVIEVIRVAERVTLHNAHVLVRKIPGTIEPRLAV